MTKSKKLLLAFATLTVAASLVAVPVMTVSCDHKKDSEDSKDVPSEINTIGEVHRQKDLKPTDAHKKDKAVVITDSGRVDDLSFNQSVYEGLKALTLDLGIYQDSHLEPIGKDEYESTYLKALNDGYKYLLLVGFQHKENIEAFLKDESHRQEIIDKGIIIISIDFEASNIPEGHQISLQYNTKEAGWVAGYGSAKYLSARKSQDKRWVSSFGGGEFPGVTDFNEGFLKGILYFNEHNPTMKTKHVEYDSKNYVSLTSGFDSSNAKMTTVVDNIIAGSNGVKPSIILPVAGTATTLVASKISDDQLIIGVDVDQSKAIKQNQDHFITSITKGLTQSVYDVLQGLYTENPDKLYGFVLNEKSTIHYGGIDENWSGVSKSNLAGDEKSNSQFALDEAHETFEKLSQADRDFINGNAYKLGGSVEKSIQTRLNKLVEEVNK